MRAPRTPRTSRAAAAGEASIRTGWGLPPTAPLLVALAVLLAVLALLWVQARPLSSRFVNRPATLGAMSGALSLVGTVLLSSTIVLSARLRFVERSAGGLDRVYRVHHRLGALSFTLLALHPSLLAWRYAQVSWPRSAELWRLDPSDVPLLAGQVSLYGMAIGVAITMFWAVRHQVMLWTQRLLGLLFLPAGYHVLRMGGDVDSDPALRLYMAVIVAAGVLALVIHTVAGRLLTPHYGYLVDSVEPLNAQITEITLHPTGRSMPFVAGQFAFLRFAHQPVGGEAHPYSMASPPGEQSLRFTIKHLGDYTAHIDDVAPGAHASIEGPYGRFSHRYVRGKQQAWIAGGIGIAPFLSMAASLDDRAGYTVTLFYGYADDGPPLILAELTELAAAHRNLTVVLVAQQRDGVVDAALLRARLGGLEGIEFLLCGPPPMLHALQHQLDDAGVSKRRIHFEEFDFA